MRRLFSHLICMASALLLICAADARPFLLLFGTPSCDECAAFKAEWSQQVQDNTEAPCLVFIDIDQDGNYDFLQRLENTLNVQKPASSFPLLLAGRHFIPGIAAFQEQTEQLDAWLAEDISDVQELSPISALVRDSSESLLTWNADLMQKTAQVLPQAPLPPLLYFYAKGCQKCSRQMKELSNLRRRVPSLALVCQDIATENGQIYLRRVTEHFGLEETGDNLAPMLVLPEQYITGRLATADELTALLSAPSTRGPLFWEGPVTAAERGAWHTRAAKITGAATIGLVALAGLFDGINPCAFATSIFLIGYLLYLKRRARDIVITGAAFCTGVFITYLLFGFGLSFIIDFLASYAWLKQCLYLAMTLAALVLAVWNLKDAIAYRKSGNLHDIDLGLSLTTHQRIHEKIKWLTTTSTWLMAPAAILLGILVSSMELACTGQIYLPTLAAINSQGLNVKAIAMLCLYNICFIIPLAVTTVLAAAGFGAKRISLWARNNIFSTKLVLSFIFAILAALMAVFVAKDWRNARGSREMTHDCFHESSNTLP